MSNLNFKYLKSSFCAIFVAMLLLQCSTEKNAWPNRTYHNITAHFNGYFNANEIIKATMGDFAVGRKDDYSKIIPVFEYANNEESKVFYSPMDTAVKKCETVIVRNSMPKKKTGQHKKTEWCKWIDDNWFTIGQAQFYKRDFEGAMEKFDFIAKQYSSESIVYHALLWKAKTLIEQGVFEEAEKILEKLSKQEELQQDKAEEQKLAKEKAKKYGRKVPVSDDDKVPELPKNFNREVLPVYADLYLRQEKYEKAIEKLLESIEVVKKRQFRTRLIFILAQIYHRQGDLKASELYAEVVKLNPEYDLAFQAKINRALAYSGGDKAGIKATLIKMLKDEKNLDYLDQIYYALADIELRDNNKDVGIRYLELSVASSTNNNTQKSKSFLRLGNLHYADKNYPGAQQYYDSTMSVLPKEHPEYLVIEERNKSLTELVYNLRIIEKEDSIVNFCQLPEEDKIKKIELIIADLIEKEEAEKARLAELASSPFSGGIPSPTGATASSGAFWVWDNNLRGVGFNDFKKSWGTRVLEDNWRRSDKSASLDESDLSESNSEEIRKEHTVDFYLQNSPCSDSVKLNKSEDKIMTALFDAGSIYRFYLKDDAAAAVMFEQLSAYAPEDKGVAGIYQLYLLYSGSQKNKYADIILGEYPYSDFAKLIKDPDYKKKEQVSLLQDKDNYLATFDKYLQGNYNAVIKQCDFVTNSDSSNAYFCKYIYLKALSVGQLTGANQDKAELESALNDVMRKCPDTEYYAKAKEIMDLIRADNTKSDANVSNGKFQYDAALRHYFILVVPNGSGDIKDVRISMSNFSKSSFSTKNLSMSSSFLNADNQVVVVKQFANKNDAMDFYTAFKVDKNHLKNVNNNFDYFVISNKNYAALYVEKDHTSYMEFFNSQYFD